MAWSPDFVEALAAPSLKLVFRAKIRRHFKEPEADSSPLVLFSIPGMGDDELYIREVRVEGSTLRTDDWSSDTGGAEIVLYGPGSGRNLTRRALRGSILEVDVSANGSGFERIFLGMLDGDALSYNAGQWTIRAASMLGALRCRLDAENYGSAYLFHLEEDEGNTYPVNGTLWTPADDPLGVDDTTGFQYSEDSSGNILGAVLIQVGESGEPFVITYTGLTSSEFSGLTTGVMDTLALNLIDSADIRVKSVAYLYGHPITVALRILTSTGTPSASRSLDIYPREWGLSIPVDLVDVTDSTAHRQACPSLIWESIVDEETDDALSWLSGWLSPGGFFLTVRQGCLTVRAASDPMAPYLGFVFTVQDSDLLALPSWASYNEGQEAEYVTVLVTSVAVAGTTSPPKSIPFVYRRDIDQSGRLYTGETDEAERVMAQLRSYYTRVAEVYTVTVGLRFAALAPGDHGRLYFTAPSRTAGIDQLDGRPAMVSSVSVDWMAGAVELTLLAFPEDEIL